MATERQKQIDAHIERRRMESSPRYQQGRWRSFLDRERAEHAAGAAALAPAPGGPNALPG